MNFCVICFDSAPNCRLLAEHANVRLRLGILLAPTGLLHTYIQAHFFRFSNLEQSCLYTFIVHFHFHSVFDIQNRTRQYFCMNLHTSCAQHAHILHTSFAHLAHILRTSFVNIAHIIHTSCAHLAHILPTSCAHLAHLENKQIQSA